MNANRGVSFSEKSCANKGIEVEFDAISTALKIAVNMHRYGEPSIHSKMHSREGRRSFVAPLTSI
jgi:hypothetical protein